MRAQQLVHYVESLALCCVLAVYLIARLELLLRRHLLIVIDAMNFLRDIRKDERIVITRGHELDAAIGEMDSVALLIEHEEKIFLDITVLLLAWRKLAICEMVEL